MELELELNDPRRNFVNPYLDNDQAPITAEIVEAYRREWAMKGFPDVGGGKQVDVLNNPTAQWEPEARLMAQVLKEAVDDYMQRGGMWSKRCPDHPQPKCRCKHSSGSHSVSCEHTHTYHRCAVEWLASKDFETLAEHLGLDPGYFRRQLTNGQIPRFFLTAGPLSSIRRPRGRPRKVAHLDNAEVLK